MTIGENIRTLRKQHHLKQSELGKMLNVSGNTVSSWETNRTEPNIGMIEAMRKIFDCEKTDIIDGVSEAKQVINRISDKLTAVQGGYDVFANEFMNDKEFVDHIRMLYALPKDQRATIYLAIQGVYYGINAKKDALDA